MADKVVLEAEVKSNIKAVSKETKELTNDFGAFGVTIGSIKGKFQEVGKIMKNGLIQIKLQAQLAGVGLKQMFSGQILKGAKNLFTAIKVGIAATGIGALLISFTALATFFTKTKKGAELLETALAGVGATVSVIVDRVSKFGGAIVKLFQGDAKGALQDVKGAFTGIGDEIVNDTKRAIELKIAFQNLRDSQRDLNVETAQQRAEIERLKLVAEDVTKSTNERLKAAKAAFDIENNLLAKRIFNAKEDLRIQQESMELTKVNGKNIAQELDKEAELKIALADITGESLTKQIELNNKINAIQAEAEAKRIAALDAEKARAKEKQDIIDEENKRIADEKKKAEDAKAAANKLAADKEIEEAKRVADEKIAIFKAEEDFKKATIDKTFGAAAAMAGENVALSKGVAAAQTIYNTQQGIMAAMGATSVADKLLPYPVRLANAIATGVMGAAALSKIMSTDPSGGGGGGGGGGIVAGTSSQAPAPQMMSGAFDLSGGVAPEATRAYVVTDEMTNSQNQLANIRRRATI